MSSTGELHAGGVPELPVGRHLLLELHGCDPALLVDTDHLEAAARTAADAAGARTIAALFHRFGDAGVTGVLVLAESHLSIHTWPEHGYAAVDVFTCGSCRPELAVECLRRAVAATRVEARTVVRGLLAAPHEHPSHGRDFGLSPFAK